MSRDEMDFVATKLFYKKSSNLMLRGQVSLIMDGSAFRKPQEADPRPVYVGGPIIEGNGFGSLGKD